MKHPAQLLAAALGLALAASTAAFAQQVPQPGPAGQPPAKRAMPDPMSADTNKDGYIDRNEAAQRPRLARHFDAIDANRDGLLTKAEIDAYIAKKRSEHAERGGRHGAGPHGPGGPHGGPGGGMFARLDANGDGFIDRSEAAGRPRLMQNFDAIDANRDGRLSRDELRAWREQHRRHGAGPARPQ